MVNGRARILDHRGNPIETRARTRGSSSPRPAPSSRRVDAWYDASQWTDENAIHWSNVDQLSAKYANSKEVRYRLRLRARYETFNNCYAAGIVQAIASDLIGTGPRLQLRTGNDEADERIESAWETWAQTIRLASRLQTMRRSLCCDGEAFLMMVSNPRLQTPAQLDLRLIEADQISHPYLNPVDPCKVDGIEYDEWGNPVLYKVLKRHPGDFYQIGLIADDVDARRMIHWYRVDRPGELRGIPELTPALPLFAMLRRYTLAVTRAAEIAADHAAVLESNLPPDTDDWQPTPAPTSEPAIPGGGLAPFDQVTIERGLMTTLPAGWKLSQLRAEQPNTAHDAFVRALLKEIARSIPIPYAIAAGDYSDVNYSSGQLSNQEYLRRVAFDRRAVEIHILDRLFAQWLEEMYLVGELDTPPDRLGGWPHLWFWDGFPSADPLKEAQAQKQRLENGTTTLALECAKQGLDWRDVADQLAIERAYTGEAEEEEAEEEAEEDPEESREEEEEEEEV